MAHPSPELARIVGPDLILEVRNHRQAVRKPHPACWRCPGCLHSERACKRRLPDRAPGRFSVSPRAPPCAALTSDTTAESTKFEPVTATVFLAAVEGQLDEIIKKMDYVSGNGHEAFFQDRIARLQTFIYLLSILSAIGVAGTAFGYIRLRQLTTNQSNRVGASSPPGIARSSLYQDANLAQTTLGTGFKTAPHVHFYRRVPSRTLYREAILSTKSAGDFGPVHKTLAVVSYQIDPQQRLTLSINGQTPAALRHGGNEQRLAADDGKSLAVSPGDVLIIGDWEIAFS
jgi:hypothetical protein